jgi:hypothetical protein
VPELKRVDGVEVHWEERGEGPTVFFAHISWLTKITAPLRAS